jgi:hypothetical protein
MFANLLAGVEISPVIAEDLVDVVFMAVLQGEMSDEVSHRGIVILGEIKDKRMLDK